MTAIKIILSIGVVGVATVISSCQTAKTKESIASPPSATSPSLQPPPEDNQKKVADAAVAITVRALGMLGQKIKHADALYGPPEDKRWGRFVDQGQTRVDTYRVDTYVGVELESMPDGKIVGAAVFWEPKADRPAAGFLLGQLGIKEIADAVDLTPNNMEWHDNLLRCGKYKAQDIRVKTHDLNSATYTKRVWDGESRSHVEKLQRNPDFDWQHATVWRVDYAGLVEERNSK